MGNGEGARKVGKVGNGEMGKGARKVGKCGRRLEG